MGRSQQATRLAESDIGPVRDLASHVNRRLSLIVSDRVDQAPSERCRKFEYVRLRVVGRVEGVHVTTVRCRRRGDLADAPHDDLIDVLGSDTGPRQGLPRGDGAELITRERPPPPVPESNPAAFLGSAAHRRVVLTGDRARRRARQILRTRFPPLPGEISSTVSII